MRYNGIVFAGVGSKRKGGSQNLIPYSILKYLNASSNITVHDQGYVNV